MPAPKQTTGVDDIAITIDPGCVIVAVAVAAQALLSVAVTVYIPAGRLEAVAPAAAFDQT